MNRAGSIKTHDKVVALAVSGLMLGRDLGQAEGAPVGKATHNTARTNDLQAGITGNPGESVNIHNR